MTDYEWDSSEFPLAYFITFRTHGTWLHGDGRGSVDRHGKNRYGQERIGLDPMFSVLMDRNMTSESFILNGEQRAIVESAIRNVCEFRGYGLRAVNIRTNHAHAVVSAAESPKILLNAFKANSTRALREADLATNDQKIWSRGGSTRYLWKPRSLEAAIDYTINGQGNDLPDF